MAFVTRILAGSLTLGVLVAAPALAHEGHHQGGFLDGMLHPLTGLDHLAVMLAVGALAVRQGGVRLLALPLGFVAFMAVGALMALNSVSLPFAEGLVLLSVGALMVGLIVSDRIPGLVALGGCALFALAHGHVHASAEPVVPSLYAAASPSAEGLTAFLTGALLATALLHVGGGAIAMTVRSWALRAQAAARH